MADVTPAKPSDHPCKVCGTVDSAKPMCFRNTDACCETHRKMIDGEVPWPTQHDGPPGKGGVSDTVRF